MAGTVAVDRSIRRGRITAAVLDVSVARMATAGNPAFVTHTLDY